MLANYEQPRCDLTYIFVFPVISAPHSKVAIYFNHALELGVKCEPETPWGLKVLLSTSIKFSECYLKFNLFNFAGSLL